MRAYSQEPAAPTDRRRTKCSTSAIAFSAGGATLIGRAFGEMPNYSSHNLQKAWPLGSANSPATTTDVADWSRKPMAAHNQPPRIVARAIVFLSAAPDLGASWPLMPPSPSRRVRVEMPASVRGEVR